MGLWQLPKLKIIRIFRNHSGPSIWKGLYHLYMIDFDDMD